MEVGGSSQIWVLGTQFRSSTRAVNALNCWSTSPAPTVAILLGVRRWISVALVLRSPMVGDFKHLHLLAGSLCVFSRRISAPVLSPLSTVCWCVCGGGDLSREGQCWLLRRFAMPSSFTGHRPQHCSTPVSAALICVSAPGTYALCAASKA